MKTEWVRSVVWVMGAVALTACTPREGNMWDAGGNSGHEPPTETTTASPGGGTFRFFGGKVTLEVPKGALTMASPLGVRVARSYPSDSKLVPGTVYELLPDGLTFKKLVKLSIVYDPAKAPQSTSEAVLRIHKEVAGGWRLVTGGVDTSGHVVWAGLLGFSTYGVKGPSASSLDGGADASPDAAGTDLTPLDVAVSDLVAPEAAAPDAASPDSAVADAAAPDSAPDVWTPDQSVPDLKLPPCAGKPVGAPCNDGKPCTKGDMCDGKGACQGMAYSCMPGLCQATSACDGKGGCLVANRPHGAACDDKNLCTKGDVCDGKGGCKGTPYTCKPGQCVGTCDGQGGCSSGFKPKGTACDDLRSCTLGDVCDGYGSCGGTKLVAGYCMITGLCFKDGAKHPTVSCYRCDAKANPSVWSPAKSSCIIDGKCYNQGDLSPGKCARCDTATSATKWTVIGDACLIQGKCHKPGAKDITGCEACVPTKDRYGWSPAGSCRILGTCFGKGAKHPGGCATCDAAANVAGWTVQGSFCLIDGACKKPGDKDPTGCAACDPTKDRYGWTVLPGGCKIGNACHKAGAVHAGGCAVCAPTKSNTSWTVTGNACLIDGACRLSGQQDPLKCGACDPAKDRYGWTLLATRCKIDGRCYTKGAGHPQKCGICNPAISATTWSATKGCLIDHLCRAAASTSCAGVCNTFANKTQWTGSGTGCLIGTIVGSTSSGKCYLAGAVEPDGCGICKPSASRTSWSRPPGCTVTTSWLLTASGGGNAEANGVTTDAAGNIYQAGFNKGPAIRGISPGGQIRWQKYYSGSGNTTDIAMDAKGNIYVVGAMDPLNIGYGLEYGFGGSDAYIISLTSSGKFRWAKVFGAGRQDGAYGVAVDGAGNVYMVGNWTSAYSSYTYSINFGGGALKGKDRDDVFLASFTSDGKHRWAKVFSGPSNDYGRAVTVDSKGHVYITGKYYGSINMGGGTLSNKYSAAFLASYTSSGAYRWSRSLGAGSGGGTAEGKRLAMDSKDNVYMLATHQDNSWKYKGVNFGGGYIKSKGNRDIILASYTAAGTYRWARGFGSNYSDVGNGLAVDHHDDVYITGGSCQGSSTGCSGVSFGGGLGKKQVYLASFTPGGVHRWSRFYDAYRGQKVTVDFNGNVLLQGYSMGSTWAAFIYKLKQ